MMMATAFFRKNSQQQKDDVAQEVSELSNSLSQLLHIAQLDNTSRQHHAAHNDDSQTAIDNAIQKLEVLQRRLVRHKELVGLVQVFESEIAKKAEDSKQRESELEQCIVDTNMQRVTLLTQRDEIANQLAVVKRRLQEQQEQQDAAVHDEARNVRIAKLCDGDWDGALDIDEDA